MVAYSFLLQIPYILIGIGIVFLLWPYSYRSNLILKMMLGIGLGAGISSFLFFIYLLIAPGNYKPYLIIELVLLVFILICLFISRNRWKQETPSNGNFKNKPWYSWLFFFIFVLSVILWIFSYRSYTFMSPHGTFDAYAIWNLRARFIMRGGENWQSGVSPDLNWKNHPDYPMLTPTLIARSWTLINEESTRVPIVLSATFTLGMVGLLFAFLLDARGIIQASIGGMILLSTSWVQFFPITQNADTTLAFYYLASIGLIYLYTQDSKNRFLILSGLMAGLSGWTKNEGLVFMAVSTIVLLIFFSIRHKKLSFTIRKIFPYITGMFLPAIIILLFKTQFAPNNDMSAALTINQIFQQLLDGNRYLIILKKFIEILYSVNILGISLIVWGLGYLLLLGKKDSNKVGFRILLSINIFILIGYFSIYLITPHPLDWHLNYSADRLLYHLLPTTLFIICLNSKPLQSTQINLQSLDSEKKTNNN